MTITKKRVLALMMVLAMMVCLVACGGGNGSSDASVAGTYNLVKMNAGGVSVDIGQLTEQAGVEVKIALVLNEDGNFTLDMSGLGAGESISGTWKADGSKLTLNAEGEDVPATLDGKTITMEQDGQSMTFEKE